MINLSKKLYISLFTLLLLFVVAGTATFAWFKLNTNAWFDDMQLEVNSSDGIKISIDGYNWRSSLSEKEIKVAVLAKKFGYSVAYDDGELYYKAGGGALIPTTNYKEDYETVKLQAVTSIDGVNFKNLYGQTKTYTHGDYVNLDLFFKADSYATSTVYFSNRELPDLGIPKTEVSVKDEEYIGFPTDLAGAFATFNPLNGQIFKYSNETKEQPDFEFKTLASNAVRFAVKSYDGTNQNEGVRLYEVGTGVGSYATDLTDNDYVGPIGARYDATKNAAFTYYNNVRGNETNEYIDPIPFDSVPFTYKGFDTVEGATVVKLTEDNAYGADGSAKINLTIWIEGWDADCIDTIWDQTIKIKFAFTGFKQNYEPVSVTYRTTNPVTGAAVSERTVRQIQGEVISEQGPVKSRVTGYKFKGWGKLQSDGSVEPYDFSSAVWAENSTDTNWTFVTMWENNVGQ